MPDNSYYRRQSNIRLCIYGLLVLMAVGIFILYLVLVAWWAGLIAAVLSLIFTVRGIYHELQYRKKYLSDETENQNP